MRYSNEDTIVALSTPLGSGAIAVIRLSGSRSREITEKLIGKTIESDDIRRALFRSITAPENGEVLDQAIVTFFESPASYTGENLTEISCHCNPLIIQKILDAALKLGARMADPGEFTFRAFLNQKMDLSQAEAVAEVINSRTRASLSQSVRHLEGRLSDEVNRIKKEILDYLSLVEISLDFSEEDIDVIPADRLKSKIIDSREKIERLLSTFDYGKLLRAGIKLLIMGKPNVGKSSLLNRLVGQERSIVSNIPGTTRDYIDATLEIDGIRVEAVDTAGVRETPDRVESMGIERTLEQLKSADIVLCLFENHKPLNADDRTLLKIVADHRENRKILLVMNKTDLGRNKETKADLKKLNIPVIPICAITGAGIETLRGTIKSSLHIDVGLESEEVVVTSARHFQALKSTMDALENAARAVRVAAGAEVIAIDLRAALDHLGEITGETTSEDVLNHIFSNFCIGK